MGKSVDEIVPAWLSDNKHRDRALVWGALDTVTKGISDMLTDLGVASRLAEAHGVTLVLHEASSLLREVEDMIQKEADSVHFEIMRDPLSLKELTAMRDTAKEKLDADV